MRCYHIYGQITKFLKTRPTYIANTIALGITEWRYPLCPIYCAAVNGVFVLYISGDTFRSSAHKGEPWPRKLPLWPLKVEGAGGPYFYVLALLGWLWGLQTCLTMGLVPLHIYCCFSSSQICLHTKTCTWQNSSWWILSFWKNFLNICSLWSVCYYVREAII